MSLRLLRKKITVPKTTAEGMANTVVEGTLVIPEGSPTISRVLEITCKPTITHVQSMEDRALIEGVIAVELLFSSITEQLVSQPSTSEEAEDTPQIITKEKLHKVAWKRGLNFTYMLEMSGVNETDSVDASCKVTGSQYLVRGDESSIDLDVMLDLVGQVTKEEEKEITTGVTGDEVEGLTEEIRVKSKSGCSQTSQIVNATLPWGGRSSPENVIEVEATASEIQIQSEGQNITISGSLSYSVLYEGPDEVGVQYARWPNAQPFEIALTVEEMEDGASLVADIDVEVRSWRLERTEEGDQLVVEGEVTATVCGEKKQVIPCLIEIASSGEVAGRSDELSIYEAVGEGETRKELTILLELSKEDLPVERVLRGKSKVSVEEVYLLENKIAIEGHVAIDLLYIGRNETVGQVAFTSWPQAITFDLEIPIRGAGPELDRKVKVEVERIEFDLINRETLEAKIVLKAEAEVGRVRTVYPVIEAVKVPADPVDATFVYVVIQEEDTLWKLSKLYHTTIESILALNQDINDEALEIGDKICIIPGNVQAS